MKPVCAITGVSGYVGSCIGKALAEEFTLLPLGRTPGDTGVLWQFEPEVDVTAALQQRGAKVLVHSAWDFSHPNAKANWQANVEGSRKLIEQARSAGVETIVFISTISAFRDARSEYGKSKLAVEKLVLDAGGTVIRPGLVWGDRPGGMFGALRKQVSKGGLVPVIGDGSYPQYLVHEEDLAAVVLRAAKGEFAGRTLTVANPRPWPFGDLIHRIAAEQGKSVKLLRVPWRFIYAGLKSAEGAGLKLSFRSDSVISLVYQDPAPAFSTELDLREFQ